MGIQRPTHCVDATAEISGCYELSPPFYGVLVYNNTWIGAGESQPRWQEGDTVTFLCDRGYELVDSSGRSLGAQWSVTCEVSDVDNVTNTSSNAATNTTSTNNTAWSEEPQQFQCSSKPHLFPYTVEKSVQARARECTVHIFIFY